MLVSADTDAPALVPSEALLLAPHQAAPAAGPPTGVPAQEQPAIWTATGHERPVFLDERGRRRRWVWLGGALTGGVSALWLGALIAGAIGFSSMPSLQASHAGSALLASRGAARTAMLAERHHRRRAAAHPNPHAALGGATELAVSRALIAAR
jgi:hypothetical protein